MSTIVDGLEAGKTYYARETDLAYATWAVRLISPSAFDVPSGSDYGRATFTTLNEDKAYTVYEQAGGSPAAVDVPVAFLAVDVLAKIQDKTDLIGTGAATIQAPTISTTSISSLVAGDDYTTANGRALIWTVALAYQPASTTLRFSRPGSGITTTITGTVAYAAGTATLTFQIDGSDTSGFIGLYDYQLIVVDSSGNVITIQTGTVRFISPGATCNG